MLEVGDKAFLFIYLPNNIFVIQEVEIISALQTEEGFTRVIIKSEATSTTDEIKHKIGNRTSFADNIIKSPAYVKNVLKKHGQQLIQNIFERMF